MTHYFAAQSEQPAAFKLTQLERDSAVWLRISKELETRLATLRERNDGDLTADETAKLRGSIKELKNILSWAVTDPTIT